MPDSRYIAKGHRRKTFWNNVTRVVIQLFVWTGAAVLYYFAFSIFFDTPVEYRLKHSTDRLRRLAAENEEAARKLLEETI